MPSSAASQSSRSSRAESFPSLSTDVTADAAAIRDLAALRTPGEEIGEQAQARRLTLLRMELDARHVVPGDRRRERAGVIRARQEIVRIAEPQMIAVHEIAMGAVGDAGEQRMGPGQLQFVPAHMGNLDVGTLDGARG